MEKTLPEVLQQAGVVGAGGAGFPTHVKINTHCDVVIANGAECEPLLRVDRQLMETRAQDIVRGMRLVLAHTGAKRGVICIKAKYHDAHAALSAAIGADACIEILEMNNFYPAGDEQRLVFAVTGKVVPTGGLPLDCGAIVQNVSTLINIAEAAEGKPVTHKWLTVAGLVNAPVTLCAPIGTTYRDCIAAAGGVRSGNEADYALIAGGPFMGAVEMDWDAPVVKTTSGLLIFPKDHVLIQRKTLSIEQQARLARAVCCQCSQCTYLCPRNAMGLNVQPHKIMRAAAAGDLSTAKENGIFSCCDCGLCTYYACNFALTPSRFMTLAKQQLMQAGQKPQKEIKYAVDSAEEFLQVPTHRLMQRMELTALDGEAPLRSEPLSVRAVRIPLKQHIGAPAQPCVAAQDTVRLGQTIARSSEGKLCVDMHASISGVVSEVSEQHITIRQA